MAQRSSGAASKQAAAPLLTSLDFEPDAGLRDAHIRGGWLRVLLPHIPPAPARLADIEYIAGSLGVVLAMAGYNVTAIGEDSASFEMMATKAFIAGVGMSFRSSAGGLPGPSDFDAVVARQRSLAGADPHRLVERWDAMLGGKGVLLVVDGYHGGTTVAAAAALRIVRTRRPKAHIVRLTEPALTGPGQPPNRYMVVAPA